MRLRLAYAIAIAAACAVAPACGVFAQSTPKSGQKSTPYAPVPTPTLDPEALKIPDSIHDNDAMTFKPDNGKALPPPSAPNRVDIGKYDLEFRAGQTSDVNPHTGLDSGEKANLSNSSLGHKSDSALPDYFGLKLSAPTK